MKYCRLQNRSESKASRRRLHIERLEDRRVMAGLAEGEGTAIVALTYQFYAVNTDGSIGRNLDPNPADNVLEADVNVGEKFLVRTLAKDLRTNGPGVFSVYTDMSYTNTDGSSDEKIALQWGETNTIQISQSLSGGTFRLKYGVEETTDIAIALDNEAKVSLELTAHNIQVAIEAVPSIGVGNVSVIPNPVLNLPNSDCRFEVYFKNGSARKDLPDVEVADNQLVVAGGGPAVITVAGTTDAAIDNPLAVRSAIDFGPVEGQILHYVNGRNGGFEDLTASVPGKRVLTEVGGFTNRFLFVPPELSNSYFAANDKYFVATSPGTIEIADSVVTDNPQLGIAAYDAAQNFLTADQVSLPTGKIVVGTPLETTNDEYSIDEDSEPITLDVLANDKFAAGTSVLISGVAQPSVGGTVTIVGDGTLLKFTPAHDFAGHAVFTYVIRTEHGSEAVGTVTINIAPVNDAPTLNELDRVERFQGSPEFSIDLQGITAGGGENQPLKVSVSQSNPDVVSHLTLHYTPNATDGTLSILPSDDNIGSTVIEVSVTDGGLDNDLETLEDNGHFSRSFVVSIMEPISDYGDAPTAEQSGFASSYPTKAADNGASHEPRELYLGEIIDEDFDGKPNADALGDDNHHADDEDGITFPNTLHASKSTETIAAFTARSTGSGFIDAWMDFNQDGDWDDIGEQIAESVRVEAGKNLVPFVIPAASMGGATYARFRLSVGGGLAPTGPAIDGEVEDYRVEINGDDTFAGRLVNEELGAHEIDVTDGMVVVKANGITVWKVPATELTSLQTVNNAGTILSELKEFGSSPGAIHVDSPDSGPRLELKLANLNLTSFGADKISGVESIDLRLPGSNSIEFAPSDVQSINSKKLLRVFMGVQDSLSAGSTWVVQPGRVENGAWVQPYTDGATTIEIVGERSWRNEVSRFDSDGDRTTSPLDVLFLINGINSQVFPLGVLPARTAGDPSGFYDSDGDNTLSPLDVLQIINQINSTAGGGEGEFTSAGSNDGSSKDAYFSMLAAGTMDNNFGSAETDRRVGSNRNVRR